MLKEPRIIFSLRRHELRERDAEGNKLVNLTKDAYERCKYYGGLIDLEPYGDARLVAYHSNEPRAIQTVKGVLEGAGITNPESVMNYAAALNEIDFSLNPDYKKELKSIPEYNDRLNFLLQQPDKSGKTETIQEAGWRVIMHLEEVARSLRKQGGHVWIVENATHGPLVEAALIHLIDPGIKDIKYLHGGFREGESFRIDPYGMFSEIYFRGEHYKRFPFDGTECMIG